MSSEQGFTIVEKNSTRIIRGCDFCKRNRDPEWTQHSNEECPKVVCNWCKEKGHIKRNCEKFQATWMRDEQKNIRDAQDKIRYEQKKIRYEQQKMKEERPAAMTCPWCKEKGHGWNFCEKRRASFMRKEEKQKKWIRISRQQ